MLRPVYKCNCGWKDCEDCNPKDGPLPGTGVESGLAVREGLGRDTGGTVKTPLDDYDGEYQPERTNQDQGSVF